MTDAKWYPNAIVSRRYDLRFPGDTWAHPDKGIIHSTEGWSLPSYDGGAKAPNMTLVPNFALKRFEYFQHFPFTMSSRALVNDDGGVQTNRDRCVQFEIVGTCVKATHIQRGKIPHLYMPELPTWALYDLGVMVDWFDEHHGIPVQYEPFASYESLSSGQHSVRMSNAHWSRFVGWAGHQHVPENTHLDPGSINMQAAMLTADALKEDRTMSATPEQIADAVWKAPMPNVNDGSPNTSTTSGATLRDLEVTQDRNQKATLAAIAELRELIIESRNTP